MSDREARRAQREAARKAEEQEAEKLRLAAAEERKRRREELGISVRPEADTAVPMNDLDDILLEAEAIAVCTVISIDLEHMVWY